MSNFLELYDNVFVFVILTFKRLNFMVYGQYGTLNIKQISCLLSADGAGVLFYFSKFC